ncbi:MAG: response regulator transcription factor [Eubacterium sp.]|nr:response regulator transcription factor [Eubacterium sp.]
MKILVVEDEKDLNRIIKKELEAEGYLVDVCFDGESAYDYLLMEEYDGVVLDIMLPKMNGFEILKKARSQGVMTPVLFLSARSCIDDIVEGLDIGADDYMVKPFAFQELSARVRAMTRKKAGVRENIYRCKDLAVDCKEHTVKRAGKLIALSPKEFAVLLYLIRNQNIVVTREQIEANIWDIDHDSYSNVIDVYIRYLRKKIDDPFDEKLIQTIRGVGYVLRAEE